MIKNLFPCREQVKRVQSDDILYYDMEGDTCITPCPFDMSCADLEPEPHDDFLKDIMIYAGSAACSECVYFKGYVNRENAIHCRKMGKVRRENE